MNTPKENPNRWYIVMVFCLVLSFFVFVVAPRIGYSPEASRDIALLIGMWAPTLGILGLRAETLRKQ
jgi:lipopolysaccharide export LptBFGC system permease protein LptF